VNQTSSHQDEMNELEATHNLHLKMLLNINTDIPDNFESEAALKGSHSKPSTGNLLIF